MVDSTVGTRSTLPPPDRLQHLIEVLKNTNPAHGFPVSLSVAAVLLIGLANIALQVSPPPDPIWMEHLTLEGALCAAVIILWRALAKKDEQLIASTRVVTEALAASATANEELRRIIEVLRAQLGINSEYVVIPKSSGPAPAAR